MNVRKPTDYSAMFAALDTLLAAEMPQMELYCEIGRLVSGRTEKGAAVAAAEYLHSAHPDLPGFSPRNLRRMRDFYRAYAEAPEVLAEAMTIGWTHNVVILEADLTIQKKLWYIRAVRQFGWPKLVLAGKIAECAHENTCLDTEDDPCYHNSCGNVRKPTDYSTLFTALDVLVAAKLPQMELYREIGRLVSGRTEKGAAVAVAEYLHSTHPDLPGFSPRNLRRMRDFYHAYAETPEVLAEAMTIGWTQNVVILEADLTLREKMWYIRAVRRFGWSKLALAGKIAECAHKNTCLDTEGDPCYHNGYGDDRDGQKETSGALLQSLRDTQVQRELQRERPRRAYLQSLCPPHPGTAGGTNDAAPLEDLPMRRLSESEMTWLKNRTHDHRPDVKSLACTVYAERFPRQARNQKEQELSIKRLELCINGEVCDLYGDWVNITEDYQVCRNPPAITRTQEDGVFQTVEPPSKVLAKLLKWTVHTLEIYWWEQDFCDPADDEFGDAQPPVWSVHVEYSNGEVQKAASADMPPDRVEELLSALSEFFE